jgi:hypothetical protein
VKISFVQGGLDSPQQLLRVGLRFGSPGDLDGRT